MRGEDGNGTALIGAGTGVPLFHQIAVILRDRILSGELGAGDRLPSEADICGVYGVSRITAKRALDELAGEGLVVRARGRGTTVLARASAPVVTTRVDGWLESISRMAATTTVRVLEFDYVPAPPHVAAQLSMSARDEVQRSVRVRARDGQPLSWLETFVPAAIGRTYDAADMETMPLLRLLERSGEAPVSARQVISAAVAPPAVAAALGVMAGSALIDVRRRVMDAAGRPVEFIRALYRPDLYQFEMDLVRVADDAGQRWQADRPPPDETGPDGERPMPPERPAAAAAQGRP